MHCDFLQWDQALQLAQTLAPHRLGDIYLKSAMQLEGAGKTWEDMGRGISISICPLFLVYGMSENT